MSPPQSVLEQLKTVRLLALDCDGVLTDGSLLFGPHGQALVRFHAHDGMGLRQLRDAGVELAVITGRGSAPVAKRVAELGIVHYLTRREDKWAALQEVITTLGIEPAEVAFVGDDLIDLPAMRGAGVGIAVANAHRLVASEADWVTELRGGHGAVREVADAILMSRGELASACRALLTASASPPDKGRAPDGDFHIVIPSRYAATRLPGKPLRLIAGKPMIAHVWERGLAAGAATVTVATDDERIKAAVEGLGGEAWMTSSAHQSGTDRLAEVAERAAWSDDDIVVNLQGDEPCMPTEAIQRVASLLGESTRAGIATCATPIRDVAELFDPMVVKVVVDDSGLARWFSRAPVPWVRDCFTADASVAELPQDVPFLRHLGLYAYRVGVLRRLTAAPQNVHERAESLEQLRALCMGIEIAVATLDEVPGRGVDTEDDLRRVEAELRAGGER